MGRETETDTDRGPRRTERGGGWGEWGERQRHKHRQRAEEDGKRWGVGGMGRETETDTDRGPRLSLIHI